jgi:hypothetical protein
VARRESEMDKVQKNSNPAIFLRPSFVSFSCQWKLDINGVNHLQTDYVHVLRYSKHFDASLWQKITPIVWPSLDAKDNSLTIVFRCMTGNTHVLSYRYPAFSDLKGTVARDFLVSVFFHGSTLYGLQISILKDFFFFRFREAIRIFRWIHAVGYCGDSKLAL